MESDSETLRSPLANVMPLGIFKGMAGKSLKPGGCDAWGIQEFLDAGQELDQEMFSFRNKGMNGTAEEREEFLKQIFHGVRFNGRVAIAAAPLLGKSQKEVYDALVATTGPFASCRRRKPATMKNKTAQYVEAHIKAYESLAYEFGLAGDPQEAVTARYPLSEAQEFEAVREIGQAADYQSGKWYVYDQCRATLKLTPWRHQN